MTHRVEIYEVDDAGNEVDVIGANYYCSDMCAKQDSAYSGWNGSCDLYSPVQCPCGELLEWQRYNYPTNKYERVSPESHNYWGAEEVVTNSGTLLICEACHND